MNCEKCMLASYMPQIAAYSRSETGGITRDFKIAYAYVPYQRSTTLLSDSDALVNGTVFAALNKPLGVYQREFCDSKAKDCKKN